MVSYSTSRYIKQVLKFHKKNQKPGRSIPAAYRAVHVLHSLLAASRFCCMTARRIQNGQPLNVQMQTTNHIENPQACYRSRSARTAMYMLLYSLLAASRLCCMTARSSTVVWSGSRARWWGLRVPLKESTSSLGFYNGGIRGVSGGGGVEGYRLGRLLTCKLHSKLFGQ